MANRHYGNIGDIWKHLPLAEILASERPGQYWESHAGSAEYPLDHSPSRDYGVFHFLEGAGGSLGLASSSFLCLLEGLRSSDGRLAVYPGSPCLAMEMLRERASYLFCDIDRGSLKTIEQAARSLSIPAGSVRCVKADGVATVAEAIGGLTRGLARATLIFIDPCAGDDPFTRSEARPSPMDVFARAVAAGAMSVLWYGFSSGAERAACWDGIRSSLALARLDARAGRLWCGEIGLRDLDAADLGIDPGVRGCGLLCGNLSSGSVGASSRLGYELARIYTGVAFPAGPSGALEFRSLNVEMALAGDLPAR